MDDYIDRKRRVESIKRVEGETPKLPVYLRGLWACRVAAGLTQRDLAQAAGIAQNTIHKLERCSRGAYLTTMRKLCEALRVDAVDLLIASPEEHEDELKGTQDEKIRQNGQ